MRPRQSAFCLKHCIPCDNLSFLLFHLVILQWYLYPFNYFLYLDRAMLLVQIVASQPLRLNCSCSSRVDNRYFTSLVTQVELSFIYQTAIAKIIYVKDVYRDRSTH